MSAAEAAGQMSAKPDKFDVILAPRHFGNSLADLCSDLAGGINLLPYADIGESCAVFSGLGFSSGGDEGSDKANPTGTIQAAAPLLE
jgi:isocitrate/isopropylmalate dehydrogenase